MKLDKLFESLAKKAGIDTNDTDFISVLDKIKEAELSDTLAYKIEGSLFDKETAKQDYELKSHFTALALNGVDSEIKNVIEEILADYEDVKSELYSIKSTPKRAATLARKIKELEESKAKANSKGDNSKDVKYQTEIDNLMAKLRETEGKYQSELEAERASKYDLIAGFKEDLMLNSFKYATELPSDVNTMMAKQLLNKVANEKGAKIKYNKDTGNFELKRASDETLDWFDERNNKPSYEDFVKGVLTQNKLLAVSDSNATTNSTKPLLQVSQTDSSRTVDASKFLSSMDEAIRLQS